MKRNLFVAALIILVLVFSAWTQSAKPQWEYKIEYSINEQKLNKLASQGWELVSVASEMNIVGFYFKRPK